MAIHNKTFVVLSIAKTASRSLENALYNTRTRVPYCEYHLLPFHLNKFMSHCFSHGNIIFMEHASKCHEYPQLSSSIIASLSPWVTMIRSPFSRIVSEYEYGSTHSTHSNTTSRAECDCGLMWRYAHMEYRQNWQVAFLNGLRSTIWPCHTSFERPDVHHYEKLTHAIQHGKVFVGITEYFHESVVKLFHFLGLPYHMLVEEVANRRNGSQCLKCMNRLEEERYNRNNLLDQKLWNFSFKNLA